MLLFEWDDNKARKNLDIHGVDFSEASTAFRDSLSLTVYDSLQSVKEDRFVLVGTSCKKRLLVTVFTDRSCHRRLTSERLATKKERAQYEENAKRSRHA